MDIEDKITRKLRSNNIPRIVAEALSKELTDMVLDHMDGSVAWWGSEVARLQEEIAELEVDLLMERNNFPEHLPGKIVMKKRSNFE